MFIISFHSDLLTNVIYICCILNTLKLINKCCASGVDLRQLTYYLSYEILKIYLIIA